MLDFTGKKVVVTGGGVGIGRAIVEAFHAAGAKVLTIEHIADRASALRAENPEIIVIDGDVTCENDLQSLTNAVAAEFGALDVLVNNVGDFLVIGPFEAMSAADMDRVLSTNLGQAMRVTQMMLPALKRSGAGSSVISISSIEAFRGVPNCVAYGAAKAGLTGFTMSLSLELAPLGIRVNCIAPETTDTPQLAIDYVIPPKNRANMDKWIPLGRFGKPEDCAGAALYLSSDLAGWVTGTTLHVDGGALAAAGWTRTPDGQWTNTPLVSGNAIELPGA
ncbi:MAG: SDR family oxidoreductase [Sphingomonadales bacterium]|nr:SDR family oxidoreductase [Sphingomonadales bacterium]